MISTGTPTRSWLRRLGRAAGLPHALVASLSPHSMRHPFATLNQFGRGGQLRDLHDAMGHASPAPRGGTTAAAATWTAPPANLLTDYISRAR
jgi:integrase